MDQDVSDFPVHAPATSSYSLNLPLSPSITPLSLPAEDLPFSQIFPTIDSLPASGLTSRLYDCSVSSEHLGFYLWSPYGIGQTIYIFMLWFVLLSSSSFIFLA